MTGPSSRRPKARWLAAPALAAVLALAAACTKSEAPGSDTPPPTASTTTTATTPVASTAAPAASASAAPAETAATAAKDAAEAGRAAAEPKGADAGHAPAAAPSGSTGAAECGTKPLPDCPLQAWMKTNANPPVMKNDLPALATALDEIVRFAPPGYTNWASIAKDGAAAARSGDLAAAKASCRTCHDQYKQKYKTEIRARKI